MRQLEMLIVQVQVRVANESDEGSMTWDRLPRRARREVLELIAEMLRGKLRQTATGEANDE